MGVYGDFINRSCLTIQIKGPNGALGVYKCDQYCCGLKANLLKRRDTISKHTGTLALFTLR